MSTEQTTGTVGRENWPPTLVRAADAPVTFPAAYLARVEHLGEVWFTSARDCGGGWVELVGVEAADGTPFWRVPAVEMRVDRLCWVAAGPVDRPA
jgi:hypothetical protein